MPPLSTVPRSSVVDLAGCADTADARANPKTTTTAAPTLPTPVQTITDDATGTVGAVAGIAANTVDQAATDAVGTVTDATATVQATTQTVANVVTTIVDPHRLLP